VPFTRGDIQPFIGKRVDGAVDFAVVYGHPEKPPARRLKMSLKISLIFNEDKRLGHADSIVEDVDESFEPA